MARAARALLVGTGLALAGLGAGSAALATAPPAPSPPPSSSVVATTTVPAGVDAVPATSVAPSELPAELPAGSRGGAVAGSVAKPVNDPWSPRRIATMTALAVVALSALGYAYGKLRSAPPRHPDLARRPPDLEGADRVDA